MITANLRAMFRLAAKWVAIAPLVSANTNSSTLAQTAQEKTTLPYSVDPLLRLVPLEQQRIAPDITPNLQVPAKPGFQAVVLRDYAAAAGHTDIAQPVVFYVPAKFYRETNEHPLEVWGLNFLLFWPGLAPIQEHPECVPFTCDSVVIVSITSTLRDLPEIEYQSLIDKIKLAKTDADPPILYESGTKIAGYSESYATTFVKVPKGMIQKKQIFIALDDGGKIISYTECAVDAARPNCRTETKLVSYPTINITYIVNMGIFFSDSEKIKLQTTYFVENLIRNK